MFELSGNDGAHLETRLLALLERLWHSSQIREATYAPDSQSAKFAQLRNYREHITLGLRADGAGYKYDVSLPLPVFYEVVEVMRQRLLEKEKNSHEKPFSVTRVCGYGHLGDGNLHFNVTSPTYQPALLAAIEPALYELVAAHGGSISAEHGIGAKKRPYLRYSKSAEAVRLMGRLKAEVFDVRGTLNPGKVL
ncbi:PREDICTED: D-2-hydroxyglutarate dehydrogenase, mitochondrial-like [Rhagoletis zephyria]|uniref:D-2-hydroxyglutarate dehydrogenase, mitochondrial-like n=1 Tax=Rhagoletis zephyria TaxID=28612 RepID=UPI0008112CDD|nr:PREDICTED: D-2-hydroxyglutarate dehydrogenase, mitochondrial-like [Rhagoletis zephyria]